jgi:hypothetical protein
VWGVGGSVVLALLLTIRPSYNSPVSWNGVGHVCTLFALETLNWSVARHH